MGATYGGPNAEAIEAWDTVLFHKYERFRHIMCEGAIPAIGEVAMDRLALRPGARVIDVGCGFGDTTRVLAQRVGATGEVVGVDSSARFIELAAKEAKERKVENVRFGVRDVQSEDLGGPYDVAFSRLGMMFCLSPVQAFRNIARSLAPGGVLSMVVWRKREDNPWMYFAESVVRKILPDRHADPSRTEVTCGPGPFSMASADLVSEQLAKAGYDRISFERCDRLMSIGRDIDEAVDFVMALGPAGEIVRLAGNEGEEKKPEVIAALKTALGDLRGPDGSIGAVTSMWLVTATPKR